ncbi:AAA domain-containing protein [Spiroplasma tabanidicola]|uniref:Superfamily I DNA/RNA helicase n=1 Tax=Spiroplasma tabanidicola TaxID=324079 RepID=A0A6I6C9M5_9MOLU|nr:AAA domain-containing protein [Spiroplasma tabanidicola]QGS51601.1 superfamily I DNA/RNA helicase [Spiroplasma tabanidicola]
MGKIIENDGSKELFLDFSYIQNVMFKENIAELDNIISKLEIENINSYQELQQFLRNSMIKQAFICLIDDKTRQLNKKSKDNYVYDAIIRIELNTTSQSKLPKDTYLGFFVNINPKTPYLTISSIFETRLKPIAQEFESIIQESRIQLIRYQGQITPEEVLRRNVLNSSNIASIGKLVSKFEEEKNKWLNYLDFSYDLLEVQRKNSLPYLNAIAKKVIKIDKRDYKDNLKFLKFYNLKSNTYLFLEENQKEVLESYNIDYLVTNLIILDVLCDNTEKLEKIIKTNELAIVPLKVSKTLPAMYNIQKNIKDIFDFSFEKLQDNFIVINLTIFIEENSNIESLMHYWEKNNETIFGGSLELEETKKYFYEELNEWKVHQLVYESENNFDYSLFKNKNNIDSLACGYLAYIGIGEDVLIERGRQVLKRISEGNTKNPYLINYLFNTKLIDLSETNNSFTLDDKDFYYTLNREQKEAVKKALNSKDVFLLQGPPGTGKTQVICEIIFQLTKINRKVLVSSQNHEAIKNVVDRLPYEPNINRIRLTNQINLKTKSVNNFSPERSVYNYYKSIAKSMFDDMMVEQEAINEVKEIENKLEKLLINSKGYHQKNTQAKKIQSEIEEINQEINKLKTEYLEKIHFRNSLKEELLNVENLIEVLSNFDFNISINISNLIYQLYNQEIKFLFEEYILNNLNENIYEENVFYKIRKVCELVLFKDEIFISIKNLKKRIVDLKRDAEFELAEKEEGSLNALEKLLLKNEGIRSLISILSQFRNKLEDLKIDINYKLEKIKSDENLENKIDNLEIKKNELYVTRQNLSELAGENAAEVRELIKFANKKFNLSLGITDVDLEEQVKNQLEIYGKSLQKRKEKTDTLKSFYELVSSYASDNYNITNEWEKEIATENFTPQMIQESRRYTSSVLNNLVNVYAMTLTSTNMFRFNKDESAKKLGLEEINLKTMDVDVVIIDEASKATLLEILMPLIYGKSLILVGDYRQLPPILKLKPSDVDLVNEITKKNYNYQELYELLDQSAFKSLISAKNKSITTMLKTQYRSHRQIMEVVNKFYDNELRVEPQVSEQKMHDLSVLSKYDNEIINSKNSVYWIDSTYNLSEEVSFEEGEEYSTSLYNSLEIDLTCELVKNIDKSLEQKKLKIKPSLAIISFYALHVTKLKKVLNKIKIKNINLIINTVDDFQGKEADYVIVNMVRNPKRLSSKSGREFLKKYERINVAFSRARELLIIVGAQRAVNDITVQIPTVNDPSISNTYDVYSDIISKIHYDGGTLTTKDIL